MLFSSISAGVVGATAFVLKDKNNRKKAKKFVNTIIAKMQRDKPTSTVKEHAGHSDPHDIRDNTMVSEGALYAVRHYNEKKQELNESKTS